ncbi:MAG: hypothetical protein Q9167_003965 [Letrouitia subvulpina]
MPLTPPSLFDNTNNEADEQSLQTALHVMSTEADSLANLHKLYSSNSVAQEGFRDSVNIIYNNRRRGGYLVVCGVGKSAKVGKKAVATMNSFGIRSLFLHPTEALHGDLGMIGDVRHRLLFPKSLQDSKISVTHQHDTMLIISYSGRTPELLAMLPHLPSSLPIIVITSQTLVSSCQLISRRSSKNAVLLSAPTHIPEAHSFGVPSPTSSTTTALALTDALALAIANRLHPSPSAVFHGFHPGGAIGASITMSGFSVIGDLAVKVETIPLVQASSNQSAATILDALLAAAKSSSGWVRPSPTKVIGPRQIQRIGKSPDIYKSLESLEEDTVIERTDWISLRAESTILEAKRWILVMRKEDRGKSFLKVGTIMGIVDANQEVSGVVEIEDVVGEAEVESWR